MQAVKVGHRPPIITAGDLEKLASLQCTQAEAAAFFGVSLTAVEKALKKPSLREVWERGREKGMISLRRAQFESAVDKGNVTMQIWLGKQLLKQTDKLDTHHSGSVVTMVQSILGDAQTADID